jgi:hypothetical protein
MKISAIGEGAAKLSSHKEDAKFCLATLSQIKRHSRSLKKLGVHRRRRAVKFGVFGEGAQ